MLKTGSRLDRVKPLARIKMNLGILVTTTPLDVSPNSLVPIICDQFECEVYDTNRAPHLQVASDRPDNDHGYAGGKYSPGKGLGQTSRFFDHCLSRAFFGYPESKNVLLLLSEK